MSRTNPEICVVCRMRSGPNAIGSGPKDLSWFCDDCGPQRALMVHRMTKHQLDPFEQTALDEAIEHAPLPGDKTDLAEFTREEARIFVLGLFRVFGDSIRAQIDSGRAPF